MGPETVRHEIEWVMTVARRVAGPQWVYDNLVMPLTSNGATCPLPEDHACDEELDVESLLSRWLRVSYLRHRTAGLARHTALRLASLKVTGLEPPAPGPTVDLLLRELDRSAAPAVLPVVLLPPTPSSTNSGPPEDHLSSRWPAAWSDGGSANSRPRPGSRP